MMPAGTAVRLEDSLKRQEALFTRCPVIKHLIHSQTMFGKTDMGTVNPRSPQNGQAGVAVVIDGLHDVLNETEWAALVAGACHK